MENQMNFWLDRPVLVTGSTGLLGSWLVKRLIELKADVVCLVRDWVPASEMVRSGSPALVTIVRGDVCDRALMERTIGEYEIRTVLHLAAQTIVSIANRNPISTFESNIAGTWSVLEACRRSPTIEQIVVASSDKAYGEHDKLPYDETAPLKGVHPYDVSKSCADLIAQSYSKTFHLPVAVTRCGNLYGGGDLNWNRIVPGTIRSVIRGQRPVIRSDGKFIRDYFYVEDAVEAVLALAGKMSEIRKGRRVPGPDLMFNFSDERPLSVIDLVHAILKRMDSDLKPIIRDEARNEIRRQYLSAKKARKFLGWKPVFGVDEGLNRTIAWYREFFSK